MNRELLAESYFEALIRGDRPLARAIVAQAEAAGWPADLVLTDLHWPAYETLEKLYRNDQLGRLSYRIGGRLLRQLVDQTSLQLDRSEANGRSVLAVCGPSETDELGAQMAVDLIEAGGFAVVFAGGSIPPDEIMAYIHEFRPDVYLSFASGPQDLPDLRYTIDRLHEIGACPDLQIAVGGGVFNRADGLAEEIGADLWASDPLEMVDRLIDEPQRRAQPDQRTVGRNRAKVRRAA